MGTKPQLELQLAKKILVHCCDGSQANGADWTQNGKFNVDVRAEDERA